MGAAASTAGTTITSAGGKSWVLGGQAASPDWRGRAVLKALHGDCGASFFVSHPFARKRRMDGAPGALCCLKMA